MSGFLFCDSCDDGGCRKCNYGADRKIQSLERQLVEKDAEIEISKQEVRLKSTDLELLQSSCFKLSEFEAVINCQADEIAGLRKVAQAVADAGALLATHYPERIGDLRKALSTPPSHWQKIAEVKDRVIHMAKRHHQTGLNHYSRELIKALDELEKIKGEIK